MLLVGIVGWRCVWIFSTNVREINTQLTTHNLVAVQVPHCRCGGVCICKFTKTESLRSARVLIVDESEVQYCTH